MPPLSNTRHERFCEAMAQGKTQDESYVHAGYKPDSGNAARLTANDRIQVRIAEIQEEILNAQLVDADRLHRRWSEMFEADINDILSEDGRHYKPINQWPKIWRQMVREIDVKELFERSKDGGNASWDKVGELVKIKWMSFKDISELLGRHKKVDAFVAQKQEEHLHLHLHADVEDRLTKARRIASDSTTTEEKR